MGRIFITGDTHGDLDLRKLTSKRFPTGRTLTSSDYVIITGDVGAVWDGGKTDRYLQSWYASKHWTTLFVDGNHENHDLLDSLPVTRWHGGDVHVINPHLIHLMRGQVYDIAGKTVFALGGARSHDIDSRKPGVSWWSRELPSADEITLARKQLESTPKIDIILTHEAPASLVYRIYNGDVHSTPYSLSAFLDEVYYSYEFGHWYFGHHHMDFDYDRISALYQRVIEVQ